jgi:hypothetical protein
MVIWIVIEFQILGKCACRTNGAWGEFLAAIVRKATDIRILRR